MKEISALLVRVFVPMEVAAVPTAMMFVGLMQAIHATTCLPMFFIPFAPPRTVIICFVWIDAAARALKSALPVPWRTHQLLAFDEVMRGIGPSNEPIGIVR